MTINEQFNELYVNRGKRARELHDAGDKVVGYFCAYVPEEIIAAFGMVPYRIQGSQSEPIDKADAFIETTACPFARSCLNLALRGSYDFLDGFVSLHSCDTLERMYSIWRLNKPSPYNHMIDVPHMMGPSSETFYRKELDYFIKTLEDWTGSKFDMEKLKDAVKLYNKRRAVLRELYELRKTNPPLVSGAEITKVIVAGMGVPAAEHIELVEQFIAEVKKRSQPETPKVPRIFIWGTELDDSTFIELVEDSGSQVVMDDLCTGTRFFWDDVPETADPLDGIVSRYLGIHCPRSYVPQIEESREKDLENRFGYINNFVKDWNVDAAIFYIVRYCDTSELEGPDLREYLNGMNLPVLMIEDDYSISTIGQLRTRVQAFLEMIE